MIDPKSLPAFPWRAGDRAWEVVLGIEVTVAAQKSEHPSVAGLRVVGAYWPGGCAYSTPSTLLPLSLPVGTEVGAGPDAEDGQIGRACGERPWIVTDGRRTPPGGSQGWHVVRGREADGSPREDELSWCPERGLFEVHPLRYPDRCGECGAWASVEWPTGRQEIVHAIGGCAAAMREEAEFPRYTKGRGETFPGGNEALRRKRALLDVAMRTAEIHAAIATAETPEALARAVSEAAEVARAAAGLAEPPHRLRIDVTEETWADGLRPRWLRCACGWEARIAGELSSLGDVPGASDHGAPDTLLSDPGAPWFPHKRQDSVTAALARRGIEVPVRTRDRGPVESADELADLICEDAEDGGGLGR